MSENNTATATPKSGRKPAAPKASPKADKLVYPKLVKRECLGKDALTADDIKALLGYEEETETKKFGENYTGVWKGVKFRLLNSSRNRPFDLSNAQGLAQVMLTKAWRYNGQPILVTQSAEVVSGQHRGMGVIIAQAELDENPVHWGKDQWPNGKISIETDLTLGLPDDQDVINTIDVCRERTLADLLFTNQDFFKKRSSKRKERIELAKATEFTARFLWGRVWGDLDAYSPSRTLSGLLDLIQRHPKLVRIIEHVYDEHRGNADVARRILPVGTASAVCWLMAVSASDYDHYHSVETPSDKKLDFSRLERATEFFTLLFGSPEFQPVRNAIGALANDETGTPGTIGEKLVVLAKAWEAFHPKGKMKVAEAELAPLYVDDEDGDRVLGECANFGGIDPLEEVKEEEDEGEGEGDGEEEEVGKAEARKAKAAEIAAELKARRAKKEEPKANRIKEAAPAATSIDDQLAELKARHDDRLLLFRQGDRLAAWREDAQEVSKLLKTQLIVSGKDTKTLITKDLEGATAKLTEAGFKLAVIYFAEDGIEVELLP